MCTQVQTFSSTNFSILQVYGNLVEENIIYRELQKFVARKFVVEKVFGKIWAKYPFHPKKLPDPTTMELKD